SERLIRSAHDCSDGGIAVALAECCFGTNGIGAEATLEAVAISRELALNEAATLFGESASRVVLSVASDNVTEVLQRAAARAVPAKVIGETGGNRLRIAVAGRATIDLSIDEAERLWSRAIESRFERRVA